MKVIFISYDGMTDVLGQSQVIPYLSGLTKYGYSFTILSCDKPAKYTAQAQYVKDLLKELPIEWVSLPYHKHPPVLSSLYDLLRLKQTAVKLQKQYQFDMVHTRPGLASIVGLYLKKKYKVKFLDDIRGFWPDERVDGGIWNVKNPVFRIIYNFFKRHERESLELADYTVCLTYAAQKEMHTWAIPGQPIPIEVIPCSVDLDLFNPDTIDTSLRSTFAQELKITEDDFIISYLGSIGGWYLTDSMMKFCKELGDRIKNAKFLFISPDDHAAIIASAERYGLGKNRLILRRARRHEVPVLLSFSKYSVFFIKPCYSKIASSPTKHGEIMAMGIPVITNAGVGDVQEVVKKYNGGYILNDFSDASFHEVIDQIIAGKHFDKAIIRQGAKDFYALDNAIARYKKVYDAVIGKPE
jgi:glycosyltransferase involved in cell wall biosynthesis